MKVYLIGFGRRFRRQRAYVELQSLATAERFLDNPDTEFLRMLQFNASIADLQACGQAGDVAKIRQRASIGRVINGDNASGGAWPWQVALSVEKTTVSGTYADRVVFAGGSLINRNWVLTASHVFKKVTSNPNWKTLIVLTFGIHRLPRIRGSTLSSTAQVFRSAEVIIHEQYVEGTFDFDIALIKIGRKLEPVFNRWVPTSQIGMVNYTAEVRRVCLPCMEGNCVGEYLRKDEILSGRESKKEKCRIERRWLLQEDEREKKNILSVITGFGKTSTRRSSTSDVLKQGLIRLRSENRCRADRDVAVRHGLPNKVQFTENMLCGIGDNSQDVIDACQGDSGGPLVRQVLDVEAGENCWVQLGIVSWGLECAETYTEDGQTKYFPGYYSKITSFTDWISENIKEEKCLTRELSLLEEGRKCRKICQSDSDCRGMRRRCRCDDVCGMSCFNPVATCRLPAIPSNGNIDGGNLYGQVLTYSCNDGYILIGNQNRTCRSDRKWSGQSPTCMENSRVRDTALEAFGTPSQSSQNILSSLPSVRRFIRTKDKASHEIYFLFDLSKSVNDDTLNNFLTFAVKLIERLKSNASGVINYGVVVFASEVKVIIDTQNQQPSPEVVIENILKISLQRPNIQKKIRKGTNTEAALREVASQIAFSYEQDENQKERHVFVFTDGKHNWGGPPQRVIESMKQQAEVYGPVTFYSITSCIECTNAFNRAYEELLALADGNAENFIFIENSNAISELLDQVTDARIDFSKCGQGGDVKSFRRQASPGRVIGGTRVVSIRSWPWQVLVSLFSERVVESYSNRNIRGGGSLINNKWVLTAAHLFDGTDKTNNWEETFLLTFGIYQRPNKRNHLLPSKVKAYKAKRIIIHPSYEVHSLCDYDIALIAIGREYEQLRRNFVPTGMQDWVKYTDSIRPVCLPCMDGNCVREQLLRDGQMSGNETEEEKCRIETNFLLNKGRLDTVLAVSTGFGITASLAFGSEANADQTSAFLQQGLLNIRDDDFCSTVTDVWLRGRWLGLGKHIPSYTNSMLCATSGRPGRIVDSCMGDNGGPLVTEVTEVTEETRKSCWVQIGITSWGWGCGQSLTIRGRRQQVPGFYTNVMKVSSWIKTTIENTSSESH